MQSRTVAKVVGAGVAGGVLALAGYNLAGAVTGSTSVPAEQSQAAPGYGMPGGPGAGETPLTGETAEKVTAAAQAEVPKGTVTRVETDAQGGYEAHVTKPDGTEVVVQVDESFNVTGVNELPAGMRGPAGRGHGPGMGETPLTGRTAVRVKAAAEAKVPGGTITRVETDADGGYEAHVTRADGTEVVVKVNKRFRVTGVETMPAPPSGAQSPGVAPTPTPST